MGASSFAEPSMTESQRAMLSAGFSLTLIALAAFVMQRFFLPLIWAGILSVATWPMYCRMRARLGRRPVLAALLMTLICACCFIVPVLLGVTQLAREAPEITSFIAEANNDGIPPPDVLQSILLAGDAEPAARPGALVRRQRPGRFPFGARHDENPRRQRRASPGRFRPGLPVSVLLLQRRPIAETSDHRHRQPLLQRAALGALRA